MWSKGAQGGYHAHLITFSLFAAMLRTCMRLAPQGVVRERVKPSCKVLQPQGLYYLHYLTTGFWTNYLLLNRPGMSTTELSKLTPAPPPPLSPSSHLLLSFHLRWEFHKSHQFLAGKGVKAAQSPLIAPVPLLVVQHVQVDEHREEPAEHQWVEQLVAAVNGNVVVRVVSPQAGAPTVGHVLVVLAQNGEQDPACVHTHTHTNTHTHTHTHTHTRADECYPA